MQWQGNQFEAKGHVDSHQISLSFVTEKWVTQGMVNKRRAISVYDFTCLLMLDLSKGHELLVSPRYFDQLLVCCVIVYSDQLMVG